VPRSAVLPPALRYKPFRGSVAVAAGLLTARQLDGPAWRRLFRDVYICADATVDHLTLCQAAALLLPAGAALSHRSAAMLHSANVLVRDQPVEATAGAGLRSQAGLRVTRSRLEPVELWRRGGLPVTSPLRTAFDLARAPDLITAVAGLDAMLFRRAIKPDAFREYLARHRRWTGVGQAARALDLARADAESPMETRLRLAIVLSGLPEPVVQYDVLNSRGVFVARLDLAYPKKRIGLEYDGDHHRERDNFRHDAVRLNRLRLLGWTVLRFTADDVFHNPDRMLGQIRAVLDL
jgi:very-short-patch-repair endonuclease